MPVRNHDKIQVLQANVQGFDIGGKDLGIVAGIKQNLLTRILDQNGEPPILLDVFRIPKSVIENVARPLAGAESKLPRLSSKQQSKLRPFVVNCIYKGLLRSFVTKIEVQ